jgi:hypothetical protein
MVALRDRVAPPRVQRPGAGGAGVRLRARLALGLRGLSPRRRGPVAAPFARCARHDIRAVVAGPDRRLVSRVDYALTGHRKVVRTRGPLRPLRIARRGLRSGRAYRLLTTIRLRDGRGATRTRTFRAC